MKWSILKPVAAFFFILPIILLGQTPAAELDLIGAVITPHVRAEQWKWADPLDGPVGARVQFFVRNTSTQDQNTVTLNTVSFDGSFPLHHIMHGKWAWADTPNEWPGGQRKLPPGALSVWTFNAVEKTWRDDEPLELRVVDWSRDFGGRLQAGMAPKDVSLETITFLGEHVEPTRLIIHVENDGVDAIRLGDVRLWLPENPDSYRLLYPQATLDTVTYYPADGVLPPRDQAIITVETTPLPLTYAATEVDYRDGSGNERTVWGHVRIKRESFDIGAGWINHTATDGRSVLTHEAYLKALKRLHVNAAHIGVVEGYNDSVDAGPLYKRYPIKSIGPLRPLEKYNQRAMLPHIHTADFLGEPQLPFGGLLPQSVLQEFFDYRTTRIPTSVTLSDERTFRYYAGLSDYPHCDAYRVNAPSADSWRLYDWDGRRIGWGAPLETIGELCRVLRELSRPMPTAAWSQGPHDGWGSYGGRTRLSPTPDELVMQAYHVLSTRVTSFYWFNLSLPALVRFPDTIEPMTRLGREMRMLEDFYLTGAAYEYERLYRPDLRPDWDLASIVAPAGALLFAMDLDYLPDHDAHVFRFGTPRSTSFRFRLPPWLQSPADVFRVNADGLVDVEYSVENGTVVIQDRLHKAGVYLAAADSTARATIERKREQLLAEETALGFDPANNNTDLKVLSGLIADD